MNMGIEQFVWQYLGRPNLKIVGDTASNPMTKEKIDYIKIINVFYLYYQYIVHNL